VGGPPVGPPTVGGPPGGTTPVAPSYGTTTVRPRQGGGRHAQQSAPGAGLNRRQALAALAGAPTAGLGIGAWEVAAHVLSGSGAKQPIASQFTLPKVAPGKLAWRFNANAPVSSVAQAGNVVYAATQGNAIFALNATTGKQV